jgi:NDP-sugar pyrophosphorylase family protein
MGLAIVVLAAGLGTRYGGLKQLVPLGPSGEIVLDYTLRDAAAAGFALAVLVVGDGMVDAMAEHLGEIVPPIAVRIAVQPTPLGTAHASVVGADGLAGPFAVANADDLYGKDAIVAIADYLRASPGRPSEPSAAVVGYAAHSTLSTKGGVSRAVCQLDDRRRLLAIAEHTGVRLESGQLVSDTAILDADTLVSMNLWGFGSEAFALVAPEVAHFVANQTGADRELRLPDLVGALVARRALTVTVLPTTSEWLGVTYPEDAPYVRERLAALTAAGVYPTR